MFKVTIPKPRIQIAQSDEMLCDPNRDACKADKVNSTLS